MTSIRSKPASRFQPSCFSSVYKRRIRSSLCVEASSVARMHSRRRQLVASNYDPCFRHRALGRPLFPNTDKNGVFEALFHLWFCAAQGPFLKFQVPWQYRISRRSSDRCLFRTGALLCSALDRWRLNDGDIRRSSTLPMYTSAVLQTWSYKPSGSTQGSSLHRLMLWRGTRWTPSTGGPHWRFFTALLAGSSADRISRTSAPLLTLSTGPMLFRLSSDR